ncbi:hypothetical protein F5148DRAFT_403768 [Russula earlei]|uniref:Uncharacterized protein n=1 Tax=Russula earlei TaxID=71964 RepID=A0ACC0UIJ7_9AGAM|nr:hypothetical protein F5148DRAFT_403768 [Russula earlei]
MPLDDYGQCSRFPTSSDRLGWPPSFPPEPSRLDSSTQYDPLGSLAHDECIAARKALCSSFPSPFFPTNVARGVLSDGTWTTQHPSVHAFLQSPSSRPSLPSRTSAAIYSLAALHVFYNPRHPAYDAFWHPDLKESTALFVHQVITMKPSPISTAPMTWLGINDMLWQLTGMQKEYFKSQGGKTSTSPLVPTRRSLRKRKPVQSLQELSTREPSETPESPRKRTKTGRSDKGSETTSPSAFDQSDVAENNARRSELLRIKSAASAPQETRGNADATPSPLTITSSLPPETHPLAKDNVTQAGTSGTSRVRARDATRGIKTPANLPPSRSSARRARERSPSFSSGSSTAVSATGGNSKRARSSSSASSTSTTVDARAETGAGGKGKGKADIMEAEGETGEGEEEEGAGKQRSTRARRSSARETGSRPSSLRRPGGATSTRSSAETDKLAAAEPPRRTNRSVVASLRSRKSRKS